MSTQTTTPSSTGVAPWRPLFQAHLSKMPTPEFVLTTLHPTPSSSKFNVPFLPRARYVVYRGMFAELPDNHHNDAPMNDRVYESDLLTITTDVRMEKVAEIFASSAGKGDVSQSQGSGGGGPCEAVFWCKEAMTQWRFKGEAFVVGQDIEGEGEESSGVRTVKSRVGERMRVVREEGKEGWSWEKEVTAHFGNLNPTMRGSFKNPAPGSPVSVQPEKSLAPGQEVTDLHDEVARKNFRLMIIMPDEVEQIDLTEPKKARRWKFTYVGPNGGNTGESGEGIVGEWKKEELWP